MSTAPYPRVAISPWVIDPAATWVTPKQFAILYRRSERRIQQMLRNGDILAFGVATYQDANGRWWLRLPQQ